MDESSLLSRVTPLLRAAGLDLVHPFAVQWYNREVTPELRLQDHGRPSTLGLLIGNSRALWSPFLEAYHTQTHLRDAHHPIEVYTMERIEAARAMVPCRVEVRWAHDVEPRRVAMQRLAHVAGLAHLSPSHLNVHPQHGPWIAFRAVWSIDAPGPATRAAAPDLCTACTQPCLEALAEAKAETAQMDEPAVRASWKQWLAVRDACPVGQADRYSDAQIEYHYTKNRRALGRIE